MSREDRRAWISTTMQPAGQRVFQPIRGFLRIASLSAILAGGCMYGFAGGGLPEGIRTVAVLPFENLTSDPTLTSEINRAVREAVQDRLGLRQAGENQADALVRGTITRYEPDLPVSFTAGENNRSTSTSGWSRSWSRSRSEPARRQGSVEARRAHGRG